MRQDMADTCSDLQAFLLVCMCPVDMLGNQKAKRRNRGRKKILENDISVYRVINEKLADKQKDV